MSTPHNNTPTEKQSTVNSGNIIDDNTTPTEVTSVKTEVQQITAEENISLQAQRNKESRVTGRTILTRKELAFAKELLENPKQSATKAVLKTYNTSDYKTASVIASENLAKPRVMKYLENHAEQAENTVLEVMEYSRKLGKTGTKEGASYASVALASAKEVLDRVHGKSKQQIETTTTGVTLTIDLTSSLE